jgi:hypothetical protein
MMMMMMMMIGKNVWYRRNKKSCRMGGYRTALHHVPLKLQDSPSFWILLFWRCDLPARLSVLPNLKSETTEVENALCAWDRWKFILYVN